MKNIHVLPTPKPSKILKDDFGKLIFSINIDQEQNHFFPHNIYITSEVEDINELDYAITKDGKLVEVSYLLSLDLEQASKVVLTTDKELIDDGVQEIDDEFLKWFVTNTSCKKVEVNKIYNDYGETDIFDLVCTPHSFKYKITIPKEEPKQETLEEAAERLYAIILDDDGLDRNKWDRAVWLKGAKWQMERSYSEEEVKNLTELFLPYYFKSDKGFDDAFNEWFKQFKTK